MTPGHPSRRSFLKTSGTAAGGSWIGLSLTTLLAACERASEALSGGEPFAVLGPEEAADFEAITARIIPSDDTPGATEAGVVYFLDNVLGGVRAEFLAPMREGLGELRAAALASFGTQSFSTLRPEQQDELLTEIQDSSFFATVRYLTLAGMFSLPEHGGNRDQVGWQLLGFEDRRAWQPPFGFYDADYAEKGA